MNLKKKKNRVNSVYACVPTAIGAENVFLWKTAYTNIRSSNIIH